MVNPKPTAALKSPHQRRGIKVNTQQPQLLQAGSEKEDVRRASEVRKTVGPKADLGHDSSKSTK